MKLYESAENYLETILMLEKKQGGVRSIDIAGALGFSKPSVSRAVNLLKEDAYLLVDRQGYITLTEKGLARGRAHLRAPFAAHALFHRPRGGRRNGAARRMPRRARPVRHHVSKDPRARRACAAGSRSQRMSQRQPPRGGCPPSSGNARPSLTPAAKSAR